MADAPNPETLLAARSLLAEDTTGRVLAAFRAQAVDALLLKGSSTERWLYAPEGDVRLSNDVDVLVAPGSYQVAEQTLRGLGFVNRYDGLSPVWAEEHADTWISTQWPMPVDLHRRLWGFEARPGAVWEVLWRSREPLALGRHVVDVPGEAERFLVIVLHAAHHVTGEKALEDLRRALLRIHDDVSRRSADIAGGLGALGGFVAGLDLLPEGQQLRDRLGLEHVPARMPHVHPRMWHAPATAEGFLRLADAPGLRRKLGLVVREIVPSTDFMRLRSSQRSLARRGRRGLAAAYVARWAHLLRGGASGAPAAWRFWRSRD